MANCPLPNYGKCSTPPQSDFFEIVRQIALITQAFCENHCSRYRVWKPMYKNVRSPLNRPPPPNNFFLKMRL